MSHNKTANLFDLLILLTVCISFTSIALLVFNTFHPYSAAISGILLAGTTVKFLSLKIEWRPHRVPVVLLVIFLVALFFRAQPYLYVPGGQDQGVYVTMSATYEKKGSTFIKDEVRKKAVELGLQKYYDRFSQSFRRKVVKGEYEGQHLPGIYIKDLSKSLYVYQFYPLHPLWMALVGKFFGDSNRVYSLVFFSLLSIVGCYLLCLKLTEGNQLAAALVAILLALNPLHAFFSKFPVTEIVALAFSCLGFLYLIKYYQEAKKGQSKHFYLTLSAGLFACMFFTRISGFIYMPFFYLFAVITILFERDGSIRKQLILYFISIFILYAISVVYGMNYSYPYSHDIYRGSFKHFFRNDWEIKLSWLIVAAISVLPVLWLLKDRIAKIDFHFKINLGVLAHCILLLVIIMACYKAYSLAFTDKFVSDGWIGGRFKMAGMGWKSLPHSNVFAVMLYLSPLGFLLFLYAQFHSILKQNNNVIWMAFTIFLAMFWYVGTVMRFTTPYHFYFSRYFLSEIVPFSLLSIAIVLGDLVNTSKRLRIISITLSALIAIYFGYFTVQQFSKRSADGAYTSLKQIQSHLRKNDLLLIHKKDFKFETLLIKLPLSYYFNLNVCEFEEAADLRFVLKGDFLDNFESVYILSKKALNSPFLLSVDKIHYKQGYYDRSRKKIPTKFRYWNFKFFLYKLDKEKI
jgi:hypothetical protein